MRIATPSRAGRLLERVRRPSLYSVLELGLIALLAIQLARLVWLMVTPLGPVGDWRAPASLTAPPPTARLGDFDPFFRLAGAPGQMAVTGLNLRLFGVREDRATGRGSAIIALPDGTQGSFAVGEEIMPGVTLAAVGADNVTISRGGTMEQLFLDQSTPAPAAGGAPAAVAVPAQTAPAAAAPMPAPVLVSPPTGSNVIAPRPQGQGR